MTKRIEKLMLASAAAARAFPRASLNIVTDRVHRADADGVFDDDAEDFGLCIRRFQAEYC